MVLAGLASTHENKSRREGSKGGIVRIMWLECWVSESQGEEQDGVPQFKEISVQSQAQRQNKINPPSANIVYVQGSIHGRCLSTVASCSNVLFVTVGRCRTVIRTVTELTWVVRSEPNHKRRNQSTPKQRRWRLTRSTTKSLFQSFSQSSVDYEKKNWTGHGIAKSTNSNKNINHNVVRFN